MSYSIRRTEDEQTVYALHLLIFPCDEWEPSDAYWLVRDEHGEPVGFCSTKYLAAEKTVFFSRAGLLPRARGNGLQRRMIQVRERWAASIEAEAIVTYVVYGNNSSLANLLKRGYLLYEPARSWAGEVHYFQKTIPPD